MDRVAAIGFCCIDKYEGLGLSYPTGNGIDCIAHLSRRGISCAAVSVVGTDEDGREMLRALRGLGIDVSHMQVREGQTSVFEMRVMEHYAPTEEDIVFTQKFSYIHTDLFGHVLPLLPRLKEKGAKIILDFSIYADDDNMRRLLPLVDYAFFSVGEGNRDKALALLEKGKACGGSVMTATLGKEGSLTWDGQRLYVGQAVQARQVVNTVGAGDSFIAGFMEGVIRGLDIPGCLQNGAALAAQVVAQFNPY